MAQLGMQSDPKRRGNPRMVRGGPSLNPSGRPKGAAGLAAYIGEQTNDGKELVDRLLEIARREFGRDANRQAAIFALLDRFAGKPVQDTRMLIASIDATHVLSAEQLAALPAHERDAYLDGLERGALALPAGDE